MERPAGGASGCSGHVWSLSGPRQLCFSHFGLFWCLFSFQTSHFYGCLLISVQTAVEPQPEPWSSSGAEEERKKSQRSVRPSVHPSSILPSVLLFVLWGGSRRSSAEQKRPVLVRLVPARPLAAALEGLRRLWKRTSACRLSCGRSHLQGSKV